MDRRTFLRFVGIAPILPNMAVEAVSHEPFDWADFIDWRVAKDLAAFRAEHTHPGMWIKVIAEAFPPLDQKMKEHRDKVLQNIRLMEASNEDHRKNINSTI